MSRIEETIKKGWKGYTPSEQKLGAYFLAHLRELPFETAASISKQVDVSPMTVGRYIRKLGYADLNDIKDDLRTSSLDAGWDEMSKTSFESAPLKARIKGVMNVHKIPDSPEWPAIVSMLAHASTVRVASFQIGRYLGMGFASFLQNLRPGVYFCDGADGSYGEILLDPDPDACLVLIDFRRYSRHFHLLAKEAAARGIRTIILTDVYCHWARAMSEHVLMIETDFGIRSLSMAQLLFELLLAAVASERGDAEARMAQLHRLRRAFVGFVEPADPRRREDAGE